MTRTMSRDIPLALIDRDPSQPRRHFDDVALGELADSLRASGLAVPIMVRPVGERFAIVHGERRWRATGLRGWETIRAVLACSALASRSIDRARLAARRSLTRSLRARRMTTCQTVGWPRSSRPFVSRLRFSASASCARL